MKQRVCGVILSVLLLLTARVDADADSGQLAPVSDSDRCAVCGMAVGKYMAWLAQIRLADGRVVMFDGPKDMFVYYFHPDSYGANGAAVDRIAVRDYYTQAWLDGRAALYVTGSDVYGPMGHELVPFVSRKAADNFQADHHGKAIYGFAEVTDELVQGMRKGHKMKMRE